MFRAKGSTLISCLILASFALTCSRPQPLSDLKYYGADSRLVTLKYETYVDLEVTKDASAFAATILGEVFEEEIDTAIDTQTSFLYGALSYHERPIDYSEQPGSPLGQSSYEIVKVETRARHLLRVHYKMEDLAAFKNTLLSKKSLGSEISFYLPKLPGDDGFSIFEKGCPSGKASRTTGACIGKLNRCTDLHYNTFGDFWYFWNPWQTNEFETQLEEPKACPIKSTDLVKVKATIRPTSISPTGKEHTTYPDYHFLYSKHRPRDERVVRIDYYVGVDEVFNNADLGKKGFDKSFDVLTMGASVLSTEDIPDCLDLTLDADERPLDCRFTTGELRYYSDRESPNFVMSELTDVEEIEKIYGTSPANPAVGPRYTRFLRYAGRDFLVYVRMQLISPSNIERYFPQIRDSMLNANVFIYDGHSGLGGYLPPWRLFSEEPMGPPKNKYQIFFFNGCSTFTYYNRDYFALKATRHDPLGIERFDILTNSIGAMFTIGAANDTSLIRNLALGLEPSWKQIVDEIYTTEPTHSALVQINGDETNPIEPGPQNRCPASYNLHQASGMCRYRSPE